jgi:multidrug efflux system outer membrane protein
MSSRPLSLLVLAAALGGCMVGPDYRRPALDVPSAYSQPATQAATDARSPTLAADWWRLYDDPVLNELIDAALSRNADVRLAVARLEEARAALREVDATLLPEIDITEASSRTRSSTRSAAPLPPGTPIISNSHRLALSTSFELDFWGHLRRASESARAQTLATRYARDVVALTVAAGTTQIYFALRSLDAQVAVTRETLTTRKESLDVVKSRAEGGLSSDLELNQAEGALADAAVQLNDLLRQRSLYEHQLGTLTGRMDLALPDGDLRKLPLPPLPPAGLPSQLLARRPDVMQSEQSLIAANAQIGIARAAQLPTFSLTSSYGGQSEAFNEMLKPAARIWSFGLGAVMPILDSGKYAARTEQAQARQRQATANYQKTVA